MSRQATMSLQDLALSLFRVTGALAEVQDGGLVEVVLPEGYGNRLGIPGADGFVQLSFDQLAAEVAEALPVSLGSPLADRLIDLAGELGVTTRLYVDGLKWSSTRAIRLEQWKAVFANARFLPSGVEMPFACHYVLVNYRVSYISDEKREEIHAVVVDSSSLQPAPRDLFAAGRLSASREFQVSGSDNLPGAERLEDVFRRAAQLLERQIGDQIAAYRRRAARHLGAESFRIGSFYDDTEAELKKRLGRADDDRRREALGMKIEANRLEKGRKLADAQAKHRLRVMLTPLSAAVITQPKVRSSVRVENRYAATDLDVVFDPLTGVLELPVCQVCRDPAPVVHLCTGGHLACDGCIRFCDFCKRQYCATCGMGQCAVCGRAVCAHSQTLCKDCGQVTCAECRGRCHGG